jgi:hypothetical protein
MTHHYSNHEYPYPCTRNGFDNRTLLFNVALAPFCQPLPYLVSRLSLCNFIPQLIYVFVDYQCQSSNDHSLGRGHDT